jgi:hypothetical protein
MEEFLNIIWTKLLEAEKKSVKNILQNLKFKYHYSVFYFVKINL